MKGCHLLTKPDTIIGADRRLRHPAVQAEIELRVSIYTKQVEEQGYISWLPHRCSGISVCADIAPTSATRSKQLAMCV